MNFLFEETFIDGDLWDDDGDEDDGDEDEDEEWDGD
jgi:hypothetical protein